jgi:hypothetical protein
MFPSVPEGITKKRRRRSRIFFEQFWDAVVVAAGIWLILC